MVNRVVLVGRIATQPELRYTPDGVPVVNFRMAVNRRSSRQGGEREADFFTIVAWRQTAEFVSTYLDKGRLIAVDGRLQSRSYQARDGTTRQVVEVVADSVQALDRRAEATEEVHEPYATPAVPSSSPGRSQEFGVPPTVPPLEEEELPEELDLELEEEGGLLEEEDFDPFADPFGD